MEDMVVMEDMEDMEMEVMVMEVMEDQQDMDMEEMATTLAMENRLAQVMVCNLEEMLAPNLVVTEEPIMVNMVHHQRPVYTIHKAAATAMPTLAIQGKNKFFIFLIYFFHSKICQKKIFAIQKIYIISSLLLLLILFTIHVF